MNKKELLKQLKENVGNLSIKFPSGIDLEEKNHLITLTMRNGIAKNMQEDSAAFEGWVLCVKAAMDTEREKYGFVLDWDGAEPENQHYQRFLYRVNKFDKLFGEKDGWFKIKDAQRLGTSKVKFDSGEKYVMNSPTSAEGDRINDSEDSEENYLENEIVRRQDELEGFKRICPAQMKRQLPVGIFRKDVCEKNAIFPHRKSAVDLWGVDGKDLYILELKAKDNYKVGVLSEILFYVMVLQDEQHKKFIRDSWEGKCIRDTKQIKAFILAPEIHPFITPKVFDLLNETLKNHAIEFRYVKMEYEMEHKMAFKFNIEF